MRKIFGSLTILTLCLFASCDNFMDVHKDFIKDGEIVYAPKVDSTSFIAGKERILFKFWLHNSPNVKTVDLYWNSKADSLIIPVTPSTGLDQVEVIVPGMLEKSYTFDVRTTDNFGNKSLWISDFGNTYGARYEESLMERRFRSVSLEELGGTVTFYAGMDGLVRTEVRYQTKAGDTKIATAESTASDIFCADAAPGTPFEFRSLYIPEEEAIDTFALAWQEAESAFPEIYRYDRSSWQVLAVSDETASDGGGMNTLLDGNLGSFWHSQWDGGNAPLPHWAVIDIKSAKDIVKIDVYRRPGNTDAKDVEIYAGPDPEADATTWVKIGEGQYPASAQDLLSIDIGQSVNTKAGRYLKLVLPTSNRDPFTSIAEIYLYGN